MIPEIERTLLSIKKTQTEYKKMYAENYHDSEYVFTWPDGKPFAPDFITRKFSKFLEKNNLPHIRFHDLRHTTASLLLAKGYQLKDIQEWLGHSDIGTTGNIYGHLAYKYKESMANGMSSFLKTQSE